MSSMAHVEELLFFGGEVYFAVQSSLPSQAGFGDSSPFWGSQRRWSFCKNVHIDIFYNDAMRKASLEFEWTDNEVIEYRLPGLKILINFPNYEC